MESIVIFGSTGAIGQALIVQLAKQYPDAVIHAVARLQSSSIVSDFVKLNNVIHYKIDFNDEKALKKLANTISRNKKVSLVFVAIGLLYDQNSEPTIQPEKSLNHLSAHNFERLFSVNTILPALIGKHFIPTLDRQKKSVFAVLSARVGSISDNRLGGWYAYRASKAGLNMIIKTASIEVARKNTNAIIISLHPGTVDSHLSKPFQANVPEEKLFTAEFSAHSMLKVIDQLNRDDTGKCFAWDGKEIAP